MKDPHDLPQVRSQKAVQTSCIYSVLNSYSSRTAGSTKRKEFAARHELEKLKGNPSFPLTQVSRAEAVVQGGERGKGGGGGGSRTGASGLQGCTNSASQSRR